MSKYHLKTIGMLVPIISLIWTSTAGAVGKDVITVQAIDEGNFHYEDNGDGTANITVYTGNEHKYSVIKNFHLYGGVMR